MEFPQPSSQASLLALLSKSLETSSILWLGSSTADAHGKLDMQQQLREITSRVKLLTDLEEGEQSVRSLSNEERVTLLAEETLALELLPRVHDLEQMTSIYIHSLENSTAEQWRDQYPKIKSIKSHLPDLVTQIKADYLKRKKLGESLSIKVYDSSQPTDRSISNGNMDFLYSQLLSQFFLQTKLTPEQIVENRQELVQLCKIAYQEYPHHLKVLREFEHNYVSSNALWWFSFDSFLSQLLHLALSTTNISLLHLLQFFVADLIEQLKQFQPSSSIVHAYRASLVPVAELQLLQQSSDKCLSLNNFFTAFLNRDQAWNSLLTSDHDDEQLKRILLHIDADPRLKQIKPFGDVTVHNLAGKDEEILFAPGSIFRLQRLEEDKSGIHIIHLTLCSDDDERFKPIFDRIKYQYGESEMNLLSFGNVLRRIGKLDDAEQCFYRLLVHTNHDQNLLSRSYHHLGRIAQAKGDYSTALAYLHKSLESKLQFMDAENPSIAQSHNCIGIVHQEQGEHVKALEAFRKALLIWRRTYGKHHPNVAGCYNNMGVVYKREKNYKEALESFQRALSIRERHPSTNYHDLAGSHNNIGAVYERLGYHDLAVGHYNTSLTIKSKYLPAQHPSIASTLENLGYVYENRGAYLQALSYLEKAAVIYHHCLAATHHDVVQIENNIRRVSSKLE